MASKTGNALFIVDNSDGDWKVMNYLNEWSVTGTSSLFDNLDDLAAAANGSAVARS